MRVLSPVSCLVAAAALLASGALSMAAAQEAPRKQALPTAPATPAVKTAVKQPASKTANKLVIQINDADPKLQNLALNNAKNVAEYYAAKGEKVDIQIVTYGPGLHMLHADTSQVKQRIAQMSLENPNITFAACGNTRENMSKQESKDIPIISEARIVPSGVVQIMEFQKAGYSYIRP